MIEIVYGWRVHADVDSPVEPGVYRIRLVEGGTYRNLASRRKYTVREIDPESATIVYEYVRGEGRRERREGHPRELAVVEAVGDTPRAVLGHSRGRSSL